MNRLKPAVCAIALIGLAACSNTQQEQPKLDYKSKKQTAVNLEIPPDLTNPSQGNRYQVPAGSGSVRASDLNKFSKNTDADSQKLLADVANVHIQRDGSQRWLNVDNKQAADIWPLLKTFWQENGFNISNEEPAIGQMETEWAQNRAKIPQDGLRSLFEKVGLAGVYSTSERDKFTIRVEKNNQGGTDVFFVHKGMKEVYTDKSKDITMWEPRPNDPNLEAAFLGRFMQYLGADEKQVQNELTQPATRTGELAKLDGNTVLVSGDYDRNWRRIGLALERIGLSVTGHNAEKHAYLVHTIPNEAQATSNKKPGMFSRLFGKDKSKSAESTAQTELIVFVEPVSGGARVQILNKDGSQFKDAGSWAGRLHTELR